MEVIAMIRIKSIRVVAPPWVVKRLFSIRSATIDNSAYVVRRNGHGLGLSSEFYRLRHPDGIPAGQRAVRH
jgi:hypothetical protein